jgi:hypothetical protein
MKKTRLALALAVASRRWLYQGARSTTISITGGILGGTLDIGGDESRVRSVSSARAVDNFLRKRRNT